MRPNATASGADSQHLRFGAATLARLADPLSLPNFNLPVSISRWHFQKGYVALHVRMFKHPFCICPSPDRVEVHRASEPFQVRVDDRGECALTRSHRVGIRGDGMCDNFRLRHHRNWTMTAHTCCTLRSYQRLSAISVVFQYIREETYAYLNE
jgi:hypothetical protein